MKKTAWAITAGILIGTGAFAIVADEAAVTPPQGSVLLLELIADGVQIYICKGKEGDFQWSLEAPGAGLFDKQGRQIGSHFGGPTGVVWRLNDGSTVVGEVIAKADAPEPDAIQWLLLRAKSHAGSGTLSAADYISRTDTKGGVAPRTGCDASHLTEQARMRYTATYQFFSVPMSRGAAEIAPAERQAIERIIHDYLIENPNVLIEALRVAKDELNRDANARMKQVLDDRRREIFDDAATPVGGNPQGDVAIVEFFDYRCPYCKQVLPSLQTLLKEDRNLRFIYKELPVLGPASMVAAHAALAAQQQGKYEAFHAAMMGTKGQITEDTVYRVAGSVGLDIDRLKQDMAAPEIGRALKANLALADALNIHGTPGFIIGNHIIPGGLSLDALKNMIADARKS